MCEGQIHSSGFLLLSRELTEQGSSCVSLLDISLTHADGGGQGECQLGVFSPDGLRWTLAATLP